MQTREDTFERLAWLAPEGMQKAATLAEMLSTGSEQRVQIFREIRLDAVRQQNAATLAGLLVDGKSNRAVQRIEGAQRNGPCPCGSGKKFKRCCRTVVLK